MTINVLQAIALTGYCRRTIYNWIAEGKIKAASGPDGMRIDRTSLLAYRQTRPRESHENTGSDFRRTRATIRL